MLNVEAYVFKQALIFRDNYFFHLINWLYFKITNLATNEILKLNDKCFKVTYTKAQKQIQRCLRAI